MADQKLPTGIYADRPHEKAPSFVIARLSIKVADAIPFLEEHQKRSGYVDLDIKESNGGKYYVSLNEWVQKEQRSQSQEERETELLATHTPPEYPKDDINPEDIPF